MTNIKLATDNRKDAAQRLAEIIGETSRYTKVPRCAYEVGPYFIEKDGTVTVPEDADLQPLMTLAEEGLLEPFEAPAQEAGIAATEPQEAAAEEETGDDAEGLTVSLPLDGFNPDSLDRLQKLVDSKATLIKKATDAACLTIRTGLHEPDRSPLQDGQGGHAGHRHRDRGGKRKVRLPVLPPPAGLHRQRQQGPPEDPDEAPLRNRSLPEQGKGRRLLRSPEG